MQSEDPNCEFQTVLPVTQTLAIHGTGWRIQLKLRSGAGYAAYAVSESESDDLRNVVMLIDGDL